MIGGKKIGVLIEDDFEDVEVTEPVKALKDAGATVVVIGSGSRTTYKGKRGVASVKVDIDADQAKPSDFDAIVIPGGYAPDKMRLSQPMIELVKSAHRSGKLIAAVCHGPQLMISADIVRGRRVTSWPSVAVDLKNAGAIWVDQAVVKDDHLITSRKPADLPEFSEEIIKALS